MTKRYYSLPRRAGITSLAALMLLILGPLATGCSSTYWRKSTFNYYHYYYRRGYHYGRPGTGTSFSLDPCNTVAEGAVKGAYMKLRVITGPWIAFAIPRNGWVRFRTSGRGMFLNVRAGRRWTTWTQKNGNVWEQRNHAACLVLK